MYAKIHWSDQTVTLIECDRVAVHPYRPEPDEAVPNDDGRHVLTVCRAARGDSRAGHDESLMFHRGPEAVYVMNDAGKTIEAFR